MNKVIISGRLGRDLEPKTLPAGATKLDFSIANKMWSKEGGDKTAWVNIRVIGKRADALVANAGKGKMLWIEGTWQVDEWMDKETGKKRRYDYLFASLIEWEPSKTADSQAPARATREPGEDDDRDVY